MRARAAKPMKRSVRISPKLGKKISLIAGALCGLRDRLKNAVTPSMLMATMAVITMPAASESSVSDMFFSL